ncbi:DUF6572 domain-containing protein [Variovorax soli]|uniref:Uncharacterized protein n=1 Tax=Variovorax soli TaxID=376815 RepID=A0ABU1N7P8_9BURK|nr:DUF6572 domain-containing protein [Variovorax soli]MDR6534474.1 hypothetical protein [Variovorax soli]
MTVENTSIVDAVGTDTETGEVRLSIIDHLPWDTEHLRLLQDKINVYLGFIESGEIYVSYPSAKVGRWSSMCTQSLAPLRTQRASWSGPRL